MTGAELRDRLNRLGYITQEQAAEALLGDPEKQYQVSRWLNGQRGIPARVAKRLAELETDPAPALSGNMRIALERATWAGAPVPHPTSDEPHIARVDWGEVYEAMLQLDLITYDRGVPVITERGLRAVRTGGMQ